MITLYERGSMKATLTGFVWAVATCVALIPQSILCQSRGTIPLPEFYGNYVIAGGKAISIDSPETSGTIQTQFKVRSTGYEVCQDGAALVKPGATPFALPEMPPDVQLLVFYQSSGVASTMMVAGNMSLSVLGFVRNVQVNGCDFNAPNGGRPRRGVENAWDFTIGQVEMRFKPVPGQQEMVIAVPAAKLEPGVYVLTGGALKRPYFFAVSPVESAQITRCVDLTVQYNLYMFNNGGVLSEKATACNAGLDTANASGGSPNSQPSTQSSPNQPNPENPSSTAATVNSSPPSPAVAPCSDYDACVAAGREAFQSSDFRRSAADFQAAANQKPTTGEAWALLATADLAAGRSDEALLMADKAISLRYPFSVNVCHERTMLPCERGTLTLTTQTASFIRAGNRVVFRVPISKISAEGVRRYPGTSHISFGMNVEGKNYNFDFIPVGISCQLQLYVQCPLAGVTQQSVVSNYVVRTIPKLAAGH